jgi:phosphatidylserine decarboxylase
MTASIPRARTSVADRLSFVLTNHVPRHSLTRLVGCISKSENFFVRALAMGVWRLFCDVDLRDARSLRFKSVHECFTRQLKDGARPIDPAAAVLTSPSDGVVGACGRIDDGMLLQAKGMRYTLAELLGGESRAASFENGCYATLRLTAGMYHRFHALHDCSVERVSYFPGELWNVNPATVKHIDRLYCRNERAVLLMRLARSGQVIAVVPIAAILVAGIRLHFLDLTLCEAYRGARELDCHATLRKGEEIGWFEHGSTIIVIAPDGFSPAPGLTTGALVRMGQPLFVEGVRAHVVCDSGGADEPQRHGARGRLVTVSHAQ